MGPLIRLVPGPPRAPGQAAPSAPLSWDGGWRRRGQKPAGRRGWQRALFGGWSKNSAPGAKARVHEIAPTPCFIGSNAIVFDPMKHGVGAIPCISATTMEVVYFHVFHENGPYRYIDIATSRYIDISIYRCTDMSIYRYPEVRREFIEFHRFLTSLTTPLYFLAPFGGFLEIR